MVETAPELPREIEYQGHTLVITNHEPDEETPVPSFTVAIGDADVDCEEGHIDTDKFENNALDPEVLYIGFLWNPGEPGLGTVLMRFALEEGKRRGFKRARTLIYNPKVVSILEKLQAEGVITSNSYFEESDETRSVSVQELYETRPRLSAEEARTFLSGFTSDAQGYQAEGGVPCVAELTP